MRALLSVDLVINGMMRSLTMTVRIMTAMPQSPQVFARKARTCVRKLTNQSHMVPPSFYYSRNRVISPCMERVAAGYALDAKPYAFKRAVALNCLERVFRAGGRIDAVASEKGRNDPLIPPDGTQTPPRKR